MNQNFNILRKRLRLNCKIAFEALKANKGRSLLSALGIIFGVAAVISMLAIGKGTELEILEQMKEVGVNNILIENFNESAKSKENSKDDDKEKMQVQQRSTKYSPGLSLKDEQSIREVVSNASAMSAYIEKIAQAFTDGKVAKVSVKGVETAYFSIFNLKLQQGSFFSTSTEHAMHPVCILTRDTKLKLFGAKQAVGKKLKIDDVWLTVIGILEERAGNNKEKSENLSIYLPIQAYLSRLEDRSKLAEGFNKDLGLSQSQLDKIFIQVNNVEELAPTAKLIDRMMLRRHNMVKDFKIIIPELLLKQQEETKSIFNIVLGIIAGISLLVGGIGIMNIMNASVLERTREIGVRMATGANRLDITSQFLAEAVFICITGGIAGTVLGIAMAFVIKYVIHIETVLSVGAVIIAFTVTTAVGIFFGYYPAKKASVKDPIESLRYE